MSLDVYLELEELQHHEPKIFIRENGQNREISRSEWDERFPNREPITTTVQEIGIVYSANITHNLSTMAGQAHLYKCLWRPDEIGVTKAEQLIAPLRCGLALLESYPTRFEKFNPENGWGDYDGLVSFVRDYLEACERWPDATVGVCR